MKKQVKTVEEKYFADLSRGNIKKMNSAFTPIFNRIKLRVEDTTIFSVLDFKELESGQIGVIEKDIEAEALCVAENSVTTESIKRGDRIFPAEFILSASEYIELKDLAIKNYFRIQEIEKNSISSLEKELNLRLLLLLVDATRRTKNIFRIRKWMYKLISILNKDFLFKKLYDRLSKLEGDNILLLSTKTLNNLKYFAYSCKDSIVSSQLAQKKLFNCALGIIENIPENDIYVIEKDTGKLYLRIFSWFPSDRFSMGRPEYGYLILIHCSMCLIDIKNILKIEIA